MRHEEAQVETQAVLFVLIATAALAFKGVFAKFSYQLGMSVDAVLLLRFGIAAPLFWIGMRLKTKGQLNLSVHEWRICVLSGVLFFFATYCDFTAIDKLGVGLSRLVLFTFPIMVMVINAALNKSWPTVQQFIVFLMTYSGIVIVMYPHAVSDVQKIDLSGIYWALGSALTYALYLVTSQNVLNAVGSVRFTAVSGLVTCALVVLAIPLTSGYDQLVFHQEGVFWGAMIAIFCTVIPFYLLLEGIRKCGATQASLITLAGPVFTMMLAWMIFEETLNTVQLVGAALTLLGVMSLKSNSLFQALKNKFRFRPPL